MRDRAIWLLRVLWFVLPVTLGPGLVDSFADADRSWVLVATAWIVWGIGLVATAVLLPISLTIIRVLAPLPLLASVWARADGSTDALDILGMVVVAAVLFLAYNALIGDRMVDGASYGEERRMLLSAPSNLMFGPIPLAWLLAAAGVTVGPIILATGSWIIGAIVLIAGLAVAALAGRSLHQLARRWIVFVPRGFVLHDLLAITEPVLFRRTAVERLGAAITGTPAKDLSMGASGLLIECELTDPAPLGLRTPGSRNQNAELTDVRRFLFSPSRPGELLDEAERRRVAVDG